MLKRVFLAGLATAAFLGGTAQSAERETTIDGGKAPLHGTLLIPDSGPVSGAAVLFIAGSGPTDRNGDSALPSVKPASLRLLAQALAERGIASLRFDKRGIAASRAAAASEYEMRFSTYVDDAAAWARLLAAQPGLRCVVIAGHSEGSLIGMLAAQKVPVCGFVSIAGAGRPAAVVVREQLAAQVSDPKVMAQVDAIFAELKAGREVPGVPATDMMFRPTIQPYLISWLPLDPAAEVKKVAAPVLILQGDRDIQVSLADAQALAAARPDATFTVLHGVSHILKAAPEDRAGNIATYADPSLPLDPQVVTALSAFVKARAPRS